jgi:hypothetical protein
MAKHTALRLIYTEVPFCIKLVGKKIVIKTHWLNTKLGSELFVHELEFLIVTFYTTWPEPSG